MSKYILIRDGVINGSSQCLILDPEIQCIEVTDAQYNAFNANPDCYVLIDGIPSLDQNLLAQKQTAQVMTDAKADRAEAVSRITVEVDGMVFDGDENAQQRMSRAVNMARSNVEMMQADGIIVHGSYLDSYTNWVLADNTVAQVTARQLATALNLAGKKQTELWLKPYQPEEPVSGEVSDGATDE